MEDDEDEPPETDAPSAAENAKTIPGGGNKKKVVKPKGDGLATKKSQKPVATLVNEAIRHLKERSGSSIVAIRRVILSNHPDMDERRLGIYIKRYVKTSLDNGTMVQIKRSFKLTNKLDLEQKKLEKERAKVRKEKLKEKTKEMVCKYRIKKN